MSTEVNNNNNKIYIIIIVILIIILGVIGVLIYQKSNQEKDVLDNQINNNETTNNNENVNNSNNNNETTTDVNTDTPTDDSQKRIDNITLANQIFDRFVAHEDYLEMIKNNFSDEYKLLVAIKNTNPTKINATCEEIFKEDENNYRIENEKEYNSFLVYRDKDPNTFYGGGCDTYSDGTQDFYEYESVNETYHKLFNSGNALKSITKLELYYEGMDIYAYSTSKNGYVNLDCYCGGVGNWEEYHIYEGYTQNNELHIVFGFFAYSLFDVEDNNTLKAMTGLDKNVTLNIEYKYNGSYNKLVNIDNIFTTQKDKFDLYEMVFTKDNENYIFKSLAKVE